jgi:ribulose-phosphate 3-epimerase
VLDYVLDRIDLIVLMTVNPGFGGQNFIPAMVDKVRRVKAMIGRRDILIEIDGGVASTTAGLVTQAGADVLVAGSAVFKGEASGYRNNIEAIRTAARRALAA